MRPAAFPAKVLVSEMAEARRLAREGPWPGRMPPRRGRVQTALEAQFHRVENLLAVMEALTKTRAPGRARRRGAAVTI